MGKTGKWFRSFLSSKKSLADPNAEATAKDRKTSKWVSSKSPDANEEDPLVSPYADGLDANKHAIAVAAATAAVAEAALAAAQAAAEVVKLTSGGGSLRRAAAYGSTDRRRVVSAIKIQSAFRAYLARRALRALKGLVKLQAHVRGHIVRKQSADMLRRMQAMARIQARASANRAYTSEFSNIKIKFPNSHNPGVADLRKYEQRSNVTKQSGSALKQYNSRSHSSNIINSDNSHIASNWLNYWMEQCKLNNRYETFLETSHGHDDKILEVDTWKPHQNNCPPTWNEYTEMEYSKNIPSSRIQPKHQKPNPSVSSEEVDQVAEWTVENSSRVHSASSRPTRGPFTPMRNMECSRSLFGDYVGYPNYMANTESSQAKARSHSAPKQRIRLDELGASLKYGNGLWESDAVSEKGSVGPPSNYRSNTYSNSGILRRQGNPNYGHMR